MDFSNINLLGKGTVRAGGSLPTRETNFDFRFTKYQRKNENGLDEQVNQFVFTKRGLEATGLDSNDTAAAPFHDAENGIVGIAVLPAAKGVFLKPAVRSKDNKKSATVSVPSLYKALAAEGLVNLEFEGTQYFNLVALGSDENGSYYQCVKSTEVADRPYTPKEEASISTEDTASM